MFAITFFFRYFISRNMRSSMWPGTMSCGVKQDINISVLTLDLFSLDVFTLRCRNYAEEGKQIRIISLDSINICR